MNRHVVRLFVAVVLDVTTLFATGSAPAVAPASAGRKEKAATKGRPAAAYGLTGSYRVGGDGGWDYLTVDASSRRLFVSRSTHVMVVDPDTGKLLGDIPSTEGVHGIALAPKLGRGFTSNGRSSTVSVFDLATLRETSRVKTTGENPDAILFEPVTGRVFTFNGRGRNATAIDAASGAVAGTVPLEGKPEFCASDSSGRIFVNIEDRSEVAVFDARKLAVEARWPLAPCEEPSGLALDGEKHRLFVGCHNRLLVVMNASDGRIVAKVPIGEGNDGVAIDPEARLIFASNGDGTLTVVRETAPDSYSVLQTVATKKGARTLAVDARTHHVLLPTAEFGPPSAPSPENPRPRPSLVPGSFEILVVAPR